MARTWGSALAQVASLARGSVCGLDILGILQFLTFLKRRVLCHLTAVAFVQDIELCWSFTLGRTTLCSHHCCGVRRSSRHSLASSLGESTARDMRIATLARYRR